MRSAEPSYNPGPVADRLAGFARQLAAWRITGKFPSNGSLKLSRPGAVGIAAASLDDFLLRRASLRCSLSVMRKFGEFLVASGKAGVFLLTGSIVTAALTVWQLSGRGVSRWIGWTVTILLLVAAPYIAWLKENRLKLQAQSAFDWTKLRDQFAAFNSPHVTVQWALDLDTAARTWSLLTLENSRVVQQCLEIGKIAGKRLKVSAYVAATHPQLLATADDADRWLNALVEVIGAGVLRGISTVTEAGRTTSYQNGEIRNLGEASALLCLRLASEDANFE